MLENNPEESFNHVKLCSLSEDEDHHHETKISMNLSRKTLMKIKDSICDTNRKYVYFIFIILLLYFGIVIYLFSISKVHILTRKTDPIWYEHEIIYEINVPKFRDSNQDGIGDLQGVLEKLDYFEKNQIQTLLLQSSIFNISDEIVEFYDRQYGKLQISDLIKLDPHIGDENDLNEFIKKLTIKNMHLIIDLPLSSTYNLQSSPCLYNKNDFGCMYTKSYRRIPLSFSDDEIIGQAESRMRYWLEEKNLDGIRVDLPLEFDEQTKTYILSLKTIHQWKNLIKNLTKPKLLLFDIPVDLQNMIVNQLIDEDIKYATSVSSFFDKSYLSRFWQIKPNRDLVRLGLLDEVSQRIFLTIGMLIGGTPMILYGDELGVKQKYDSWMPWTSDIPYGGFSSCITQTCEKQLLSDDVDFMETNVQAHESRENIENDSLLLFFRRLAVLRKNASFQNGIVKHGYELNLDIVWFIREVSTHRKFIIIIHLNRFKDEAIHLSLRNLTCQLMPEQISKEYQWPKQYLSNTDSNRLIIYPGSINIFSWTNDSI